MIDWDRVRIFHTVAEAGSFTRAADRLGLSQSAISRQISALEDDLGAPLFHRHARGLVLTEQGDILLDTAREVARRMAAAQTALKESRDVPAGHLRISTTIGIGTVWLPAHLPEFLDRYPEISVSLLVSDGEVDLSMRQADVAVRLHRPTQADLIQRRLITFHTHLYGAGSYLDRHGRPQSLADLDKHRLVSYGQDAQPPVTSLNWILYAGREEDEHARPADLTCNNVYGMLRAVESGLGLASLPDYLAAASSHLERVLPTVDGPSYTAYFVYPEELRSSKRVAVFRDFLLEKVAAQAIW
jgi:DNA-binding transcriptional LysR family regulator